MPYVLSLIATPLNPIVNAAFVSEAMAVAPVFDLPVWLAEDIAAGRLVAPFPRIRLKAERGYDLVYRAGNRDHPKACALRDWLADEIRRFLADVDRTRIGIFARPVLR